MRTQYKTCWKLAKKCPNCPNGELATDGDEVWCIRRGCFYKDLSEPQKNT